MITLEIVFWTLGSVLIVSLISLLGVFALSLKDALLRASIAFLVSLAIGALFGDAIIHLIPEATEGFGGDTTVAGFWVLVGVLLFFVLEKFLHWRHTHGVEEEHGKDAPIHQGGSGVKPVGKLILISDGFHNLIDGVIIAASYLISVEVGIATTIAVALHEIPQEIGDFGILIHAGFSKARALLLNFVSASLAFLGAILVLAVGASTTLPLPALIAIGAGSFIYIAGSDLVPELHLSNKKRQALTQFFAIVLGIALMFGLLFFEVGEEAQAQEQSVSPTNSTFV